MPIWDIKAKFPFLPDDPKNILFSLVADDHEVRIPKLRNEMNQWARKAVLGEVKYEDRQVGKQIFTICEGNEYYTVHKSYFLLGYQILSGFL